MAKEKELSFEKALEKLENIVESLEEGNMPLEDTLKMFSEGMNLLKNCEEKLKVVETKIEKLINEKNGEITTEPFSPEPEKE